MGRFTTGAITTDEAIRIDLSFLLNNGYIQKGQHATGELSWTNGISIGFESNYTDENAHIELHYQSTNNKTGEKESFNYQIQLDRVPSNLGQGDVLYFLCPVTSRRCRILYLCYGSKIWKSRYAYNNEIYYSCQTCSKKEYSNERYWTLESKLDKLPQPVKSHYKGAQTRLQERIMRLEEQLHYYDEMRWRTLEYELSKMLPIV